MTINCAGSLLDLSSPKVMAICNLTNDSFFKGSRVSEEGDLIKLVGKHLDNGADIIDIGGMSSRPGAKEIPVKEEIEKLKWGMSVILKNFSDVIISVDTYRSEVVKAVMDDGLGMVNDISGGTLDDSLIQTVGDLKIPYVLMHMKGNPETMQKDTAYNKGVVLTEIEYFKDKIHECKTHGIQDLLIDPGFGFGKSVEDNYVLLNQLSSFEIFDLPIMVGLSRKSMIYKVLETDSDHALNGTSALHMIALQNGAKLLRVHDSKEAVECVKLYNKLFSNQ